MKTHQHTWFRFSLVTWLLALCLASPAALAQTTQKVVDIPTRPGVTQRFVYITPPSPKAAVILFAGGHGGLRIFDNGSMQWGEGNFLVRSRQLFANAGLAVVVIDAPTDRQSAPFLSGFRQTPEHTADVLAVIAWLKQQAPLPVWLVGTSRGTQSAGYIATQAGPAQGGPDGVVLTASILSDNTSRAVPQMPLEQISVPVLVVHHTQDACRVCLFADMPALMAGLNKATKAPKAELMAFSGGQTQGPPCEAMAYHGFNGLEPEVVSKISAWVLARN